MSAIMAAWKRLVRAEPNAGVRLDFGKLGSRPVVIRATFENFHREFVGEGPTKTVALNDLAGKLEATTDWPAEWAARPRL